MICLADLRWTGDVGSIRRFEKQSIPLGVYKSLHFFNIYVYIYIYENSMGGYNIYIYINKSMVVVPCIRPPVPGRHAPTHVMVVSVHETWQATFWMSPSFRVAIFFFGGGQIPLFGWFERGATQTKSCFGWFQRGANEVVTFKEAATRM